MSRVVSPAVTTEFGGRVARVVIGSGVRRNALTSGGWAGIENGIHRLAADDTLRAVVIEGAGGSFSAGSDIREWAEATPEDVALSFTRMEAACSAIEELPVPVIAKVRGPAAGAGCQLALACDLRILSDTASIGMPIARLGILVSPAFAARITLLAGAAVARDLLYTGRMVGAEEAVRLGLANASVRGIELDGRVDLVIESILHGSGAAVRAAKRVVGTVDAPARVAAAAASADAPVAYDDFAKGISAFLNRRRGRHAKVVR